MSNLTPISTAGVEQTIVSRSVSARSEVGQVLDKVTRIPSSATVQQSVNQSLSDSRAANTASAVVNKEQIRVTSSMGQNDIRGNLTREKASELYQQIAKLL